MAARRPKRVRSKRYGRLKLGTGRRGNPLKSPMGSPAFSFGKRRGGKR